MGTQITTKSTDWIDLAIRDIRAISEKMGRSSEHFPAALMVTPEELRIVIEARMRNEIVNLRAGLERANSALKQAGRDHTGN